MNKYVSKQQVKGINKKLFANDFIYQDNDKNELFIEIISTIIQQYNPEDALANVPSIVEIKDNNITEEMLDKVLLRNTNSVYLQINNRVLADPAKVNIIRKIKESGYKLIIELNEDDIVFTLAKILADIVKFNIKKIPLATQLKENKFRCKTLVYNVNTAEDYMLAESSGINYYEGNYISNSTEVAINDTKHSKVNFIEIIALIQRQNTNVNLISSIIESDSLMSAQLIRLSNSAYFGGRTTITSVRDAVVRIGMTNLKSWIFLLEFARNNSVPEEMLQQSYQRALFCQEIVHNISLVKKKQMQLNEEDAYLIGLFSTLDILTGRSMTSELNSMCLTETVTDALIYRDGNGGRLLNLVRAYEEANWRQIDKHSEYFGLNKDKLYKIYFKAIEEAQDTWRSLTSMGGVIE